MTGVANTIRTNLAGTQAAMFREAGNEYPIVVRLRQEDRGEIASVGDVLLSTPQGQVLPAKNVMVTAREQGPVQIERKNQERIQRVNAEVETTLSEGVAAVQARLPEIQVPQGFSVGFGNEVEEQAKSFRELQLVLILAILLVYTVMASQYESLRDPFIIMFSIPLAAIGVVGALLLTKTPFSMQAYIGIIMLAGIVVSNAILLVDYANTLRHRDKMGIREAIELAGRHRLRPILMTSVCTMLGLVPMSLGIGEGSELQVPLARVVIGGLLTSTHDHAGVRAGDVYAVRRGLARDLQEGRPARQRPPGTDRFRADLEARLEAWPHDMPRAELPLGPFSLPQRVAQRANREPGLGIDPVRCDLGERLEDEQPLAKTRVRHLQAGLVDHLPVVEDQIEIERARRAWMRSLAAALAFDQQQDVEQLRAARARSPRRRRRSGTDPASPTPTGAVSYQRRDGERSERKSPRRATAKARWASRSPRLLPRAMATLLNPARVDDLAATLVDRQGACR